MKYSSHYRRRRPAKKTKQLLIILGVVVVGLVVLLMLNMGDSDSPAASVQSTVIEMVEQQSISIKGISKPQVLGIDEEGFILSL